MSRGVSVIFSRRDPTVIKVAWGASELPADFVHLSPTIECMVYLTSEEDTARDVLQARQASAGADSGVMLL